MRKLVGILLGLMCVEISLATSVVDVFISIPDTVCPYFTTEQRMQLITPPYRPVINELQGFSQVDDVSIENQYMHISFTNGVSLELRLLSERCQYVETVCAPICASVIRTYDEGWNLIEQQVTNWTDTESEEAYY